MVRTNEKRKRTNTIWCAFYTKKSARELFLKGLNFLQFFCVNLHIDWESF